MNPSLSSIPFRLRTLRECRFDDCGLETSTLVLRVFVAGASGVIGVRLVPQLVVAGHEVAGMTRSPAKVELLRGLGAEPVVCDAFDAHALREAVGAFQPEVVVNELTDLPDQPAATNDANARMRREGTRNLLAAAKEAGASRFVAQSIAWPLPGDAGAAVSELERLVLPADGVVLRYGRLYAPAPITKRASRTPRAFMSTRRPAAPCRHLTRPPGSSTSQTISPATKDVERRFLDPGFDPRHGLSREVLRQVRQRRGQPRGVIVGVDSVRDIVGNDVDACSSVDSGELPSHRHRAGVGGVVGDEIDRLHDPHAGDEVNEPRLDDVAIRSGLAP